MFNNSCANLLKLVQKSIWNAFWLQVVLLFRKLVGTCTRPCKLFWLCNVKYKTENSFESKSGIVQVAYQGRIRKHVTRLIRPWWKNKRCLIRPWWSNQAAGFYFCSGSNQLRISRPYQSLDILIKIKKYVCIYINNSKEHLIKPISHEKIHFLMTPIAGIWLKTCSSCQ